MTTTTTRTPETSPVKLAVIYYSSTGTLHTLAQVAAEQGQHEGAEVRLRKVKETAPPEAVRRRPEWDEHATATQDVPEAELSDLAWADAVMFGAPTRFGLPASQLGAFLDSTGPLWQAGQLADRVYSGFTASGTTHGGQESTLLALSHVFTHWGGILVPPGYTHPVLYASGRPYGAGHVSGLTGEHVQISDVELETMRHQTTRVLRVATALRAGGWEPARDEQDSLQDSAHSKE